MLCRLSQVPVLFIVCAAVMQESTQQCMYANQPILSGFFDRRKTLLMPIELLDLGFSVLKFPFASLAAGLGLGLGVWARRALPGVVGVEIDAVTDAFALGGVDVKAALAAVETVRLAGVDPA